MEDRMTPSATSAPASVTLELRRPQRSLWGDAWRRLITSVNGRVGLAICLFLIAIAVIVPLAQPYDPTADRNLRARLQPPSWQLSAAQRSDKKVTTWTHPFGTDELGRDLFVRVLHGAPISLTVGLVAVAVSVIFGSLLGLIAGFVGGWFDTIAVWVMDILLAFPSILLAIAITSASNSPDSFSTRLANLIAAIPGFRNIIDPQLFNALIAVSIVEIPVFGRIARATVFSIRNQEYITAATALGISGPRKLFRHILPNSLAPMMVQATLSIATAIISVAALGFLGLGARPPRPEWGTMLSTARDYVGQGQWWYATFPGLAIMLTVLGFNLLGDALRDALDPRLQK
jgi:peptide/nickel transport system permease protein